MAIKLSEANKSKFYEFIVLYEKKLSGNFGKYNIKEQKLSAFCEDNRILLGSYSESNSKKIRQYKYFILWDNRKPDKFKVKGNDHAHNLLRHLRNAMAHGNICCESRNIFALCDYNNNGKRTMYGKISSTLLFKLISGVIQTFE